jgi:hypothetical protein
MHELVFEGEGEKRDLVLDKNGMFKTIPVINPYYNPRIKKPAKPTYCKRKPTDRCYKHHCPHFGYVDYDPNEK